MTEKEDFFNTDQLLDEVLKTKPGFNLSGDFADRVALKRATVLHGSSTGENSLFTWLLCLELQV